MAKKNTRTLSFEALDKELQTLLYSRDSSKLISVLKEGKNPLFLEQLAQLEVKSCKHLGFPALWALYENNFIPFEEDFLIEKFGDAMFLWNKHKEIETFILNRPRIAEELCVLLPFHLTGGFSTNTFLYDNLISLAKKGYFKGTKVLSNFLETLLSPMKTYTANTYCRLIEGFKPTTEELLANQYTLFALLSNDKTSVVNFAIKLIKEIAGEKAFDFPAFADNFALCFTMPKIAKSQLIGVDILEKHYKQHPPTNPDYREQLAVLFTVPDVKLQEKVAHLLTTYFNSEGLGEVVAPYSDYLKGKAQELISISNLPPAPLNEGEVVPIHSPFGGGQGEVIAIPTTWDSLLFLLGDCIRERTATTIDLFFEGLIQLQDQLPENFKEQLAPYIAQVNGMYYTNVQLAALQLLFATWLEGRPLEAEENWRRNYNKINKLREKEDEESYKQANVLHNVWQLRDEIPYLLSKIRTTIDKLQTGDKLPFLSTPTHAPFYIDADTLADRLLTYQTAGKEPELDDLVVACNRLWLPSITPEVQKKIHTLTGKYASAISYLFDLTDTITVEGGLLPLWTQITRLKHPDKVFTEFETTTAKDYLSAVKPFFLSYEIDPEMKHFHLEKVYVDDYYNYGFASPFDSSVFDRLPYNFYNAGAYNRWDTDTLRYVISLNPQYIDVLLGKYTPQLVGYSDADTYRNLREPLQMLLEYDLPIRHGGWIFIGMALLHDKKETRDLASEYILRAISRDEPLQYLQHFLADILAQKLTPINRFVEFLDMPTRDAKIKAFQKAVVTEYLRLTENIEKKPTNHKKLANWQIC
ncbi:MAG: DUF6493 family protein [Capnocytophaga sp.]|nr:DUF6493 family protein [Capnocytophaga sp.]